MEFDYGYANSGRKGDGFVRGPLSEPLFANAEEYVSLGNLMLKGINSRRSLRTVVH